MGVVYLARDVALDRAVAIKLLPPALAEDAEYRQRFLREARTAAALSHPNIVPIHLVEERDGLVYFVMAYVDGESLAARVRRAGPLGPAVVGRLVQEVAWALGYAHGRGVVHRDIKPDNILIDGGSGRAMVTDFGIAKLTTASTMSQDGEVVGTLQYMSPEQVSAGTAVDGRADLYSLGVTAFFALTGRLPFDSPNPAALIAMHAAEPAPPVLSVRSGMPPKLAEAIDRCLAKSPEARFSSGEALAEAIADAQVTRREIAPSIRAFLQSARGAVAQLSALGVLWLWVGTWSVNWSVEYTDPAITWLIAVLAAVSALAPLSAARGVVRAGKNEQDVAEAVVALGLARDENVERELGAAEQLRRALRRPWVRAAFLGGAWLFAASMWDNLRNWGHPRGILEALSLLVQYLGSHSGLLMFIGHAAGFGLSVGTALAPDAVVGMLTGGPERASFLRRLWAGPVGRLLFRVAGVGIRRSAASVPEAAPTAVLLGRAAEELYGQLPREQRARMASVPAVLKHLEQTAMALRARRDQLTRHIADVGEAGGAERRAQLLTDLEASRGSAEQRLQAVVTALENLRLDLLRLRAGLGSGESVTASITAAASVGDAVDAELAARQEVESLTRR